ncbi:spore germination protein [Paenibacillus sp. HB172176]|uniref:spore germination protein n=1 Tax=Paenibacillus sp. HB172176 TaxID=2493690 RepID=UPI00143C2951|nr:spore germination protein [Paenibacillus sp. HB172176]
MNRKSTNSKQQNYKDRFMQKYASMGIDPRVERNTGLILRDMGGSSDVIIRAVGYGADGCPLAAVFYIDGLCDADAINNFIIDVLEDSLFMSEEGSRMNSDETSAYIKSLLSGLGPIKRIDNMAALFSSALSGEAIIMLRGSKAAFSADIRKWKSRDVTESVNQTSIRGPRESFTENIRISTALIRRKLKDPRVWVETITIGRITKTDVVLMYVNGLAKPSVIKEARSRLQQIDIDGILDSGYIEEEIRDHKTSLFPTVYNSELPDNVAAQLLEGKVAILVDGTPNVLLVPTQLVTFFQSAEDYYQSAYYSSMLRLLRFFSVLISLLFPSLYIAITTFHREMLPTSLLISLAAQREGVPFPAFVEALVMEVSFEILREAGLRMPRAIGQAVSVVGTLVIGQAAVEAGIVSAAMVIVVSLTAIATFTLPSYSMSFPFRVLRFGFIGLAGSFGLFGIFMGLFVLLLHLCSLRSFGEPFMSPLAPFRKAGMGDALVRAPRWFWFKRPSTSLGKGENRIRGSE